MAWTPTSAPERLEDLGRTLECGKGRPVQAGKFTRDDLEPAFSRGLHQPRSLGGGVNPHQAPIGWCLLTPHQTEDTELWMAGFRDPDNNYLCLMSETPITGPAQ